MNEIECMLAQLRRTIAKSDDLKDRQVRQAMLLLIAATQHGTDITRLVEQTGLPEHFVVEIAARMRAAGLWTDAGIDSRGWLDDAGRLRGVPLIAEALSCLGETSIAAQWRGFE